MTANQKLAAELYWRMKRQIEETVRAAQSQTCDLQTETKPITLPNGARR